MEESKAKAKPTSEDVMDNHRFLLESQGGKVLDG